jgi:hypothetical protein
MSASLSGHCKVDGQTPDTEAEAIVVEANLAFSFPQGTSMSLLLAEAFDVLSFELRESLSRCRACPWLIDESGLSLRHRRGLSCSDE